MSNSNTDIILAGAAAAFTIDLLVYPLDTIKTRYQSQDYLKTFAESTSSSATTKAARSTVFRGLYQGVGSVIVATLPAAGLFFTTYESTKSLYARLLHGFAIPTPLIHSLASGTAELASCLVLTPAEVIKQNAQMLRSSPSSSGTSTGAGWKNSTSMQALRMISQGNGAAGVANRLLTGYTALVARNLPFTALQFPIFEGIRRKLWERRDSRTTVKDGGVGGGERMAEKGKMARGLLETGWVNGVSAAVSGAIAAVVTTPTDVVKTRMMLFAGEERDNKSHTAGSSAEGGRTQGPQAGGGGSGSTQKRMGGLQIARLVYQERGIKGLFRGGLLRAGWTALGSGLYLGTYEVAKVWLKGTADAAE